MKIFGRLGIMSVMFACTTFTEVSAFASDYYKGCENCNAEVILPFSKANELIKAVMQINSMPLDGRIIWVEDSPFPVAKLEIGTRADYARQNHLDSFDVAKNITLFVSDPQWGIISIEAKVDFIEGTGDTENTGTSEGCKRISTKNAETIGH